MGWSGHINSCDVWFSTLEEHEHTSIRLHTQTKKEWGEEERETEHTCSHLLQSKRSLNIRGAAYPLLPCVKPFIRLRRESWGTGATAILINLHCACAWCKCTYAVFLMWTVRLTTPIQWKSWELWQKPDTQPLSTLPLGHNRKDCVRTMETCCVTAEHWAEAELWGLFEFQTLT